MKQVFFILVIISSILLLSCSESSTAGDKAVIRLVSQMDNPALTEIQQYKGSKNNILAATVDSIHIYRVRILVSAIKLHENGADDNEEDGETIKTGPALITVDTSGVYHTIAENSIDDGTYQKIKLEFHRFPASELSTYAGNETFGDFATSGRYSCIIEGMKFNGGESEMFTYNATTTANLSLDFEPALEIDEDDFVTVALEISPSMVFEDKGELLDPTDTGNANKIDNNLKSIVKSVRKQNR